MKFVLLVLMTSFMAFADSAEDPDKSASQKVKEQQQKLCAHPAKSADSELEAVAACAACQLAKTSGSPETKDLGAAAKDIERAARENAFYDFVKSDMHMGSGGGYQKPTIASTQAEIATMNETAENYKNHLQVAESTLEAAKADQTEFQNFADGVDSPKLRKKMLDSAKDDLSSAKSERDYLQKMKANMEANSNSKQYSQNYINKKLPMVTQQLKSYDDKVNRLQAIVNWFQSGKGTPPQEVQDSDAFQTQKGALESAQDQVESYKSTIEDVKKSVADLKENLKTMIQEEAAAKAGAGAPSNDSAVADLKTNEDKFAGTLQHQKHLQGYQSCDLTPAELLALWIYSQAGYKMINTALRQGGDAAERVKVFADVLNRALAKLSPYDGTVNRGGTPPPNVLDLHQPGAIVNYPAFTSTSIGSGFGGDTKFVIKSKTGRYIGSLSSHYGEHEVVFPTNTRFKVIDRKKDESGDTEIIMEEVPPTMEEITP